MGQLTGAVAHDFNDLLTPIVGALDTLQRHGVGGEREQRLIGGAAQWPNGPASGSSACWPSPAASRGIEPPHREFG